MQSNPLLESRISFSNLPLITRTTHRFGRWCHLPALEVAFKATFGFTHGKTDFDMLTLVGAPGTGKTHLAIAAAWDWLEVGHGSVYYNQVEAMLDQLRRGFNQDKEGLGERTEILLNYIMRCGLLILDDLGAEKGTDWACAKLDEIIDFRYLERRPTIITSNLSPDQLPLRTADRIMGGQVVVLKGESYRRKKQMKGETHENR